MLINVLTALLVLLLTGCGFQLRGSLNLPPEWEDLHLQTVSPNSELSRAVRDRAARAGIRWQDLSDANYILVLDEERFERRNLTIGANATAAEFELQMWTFMEVKDRAGNSLLEETEVRTQQIFTNNAQNIGGKAEEERLLREEMRQALVREILRKLRFLAETDPGRASPVNTSPADAAPGR